VFHLFLVILESRQPALIVLGSLIAALVGLVIWWASVKGAERRERGEEGGYLVGSLPFVGTAVLLVIVYYIALDSVHEESLEEFYLTYILGLLIGALTCIYVHYSRLLRRSSA
jgi:hypothetical protein